LSFNTGTGVCRWALQPSLTGEPGYLVITAQRSTGKPVTESYTVTENRDGGQLLGYRLTKPDGDSYDLPASLTECSCPDFTINRVMAESADLRLCKHCKAVNAALVKLGA